MRSSLTPMLERAFAARFLSEVQVRFTLSGYRHRGAAAAPAAGLKEAEVTATVNGRTGVAGFAPVTFGVVFIGVQVGHPHMYPTVIATTDVDVRDQLKVLMGYPRSRKHNRYAPEPDMSERRPRT